MAIFILQTASEVLIQNSRSNAVGHRRSRRTDKSPASGYIVAAFQLAGYMMLHDECLVVRQPAVTGSLAVHLRPSVSSSV